MSDKFTCIQIVRGHTRSDDILEDFCDSPKVKCHPLFSRQKCALQIILYFDELELCNPLGSFRKKHKLGVVYSKTISLYIIDSFHHRLLLLHTRKHQSNVLFLTYKYICAVPCGESSTKSLWS